MGTIARVLIGSAPVIAVMVAVAFLTPPDFPLLARQALLFGWAVVGIGVAEFLLFGPGFPRIVAALGFVAPRWRAVAVALIVSLPMWLFLPLYGRAMGTPTAILPGWPAVLLGVVLVNGLAEEIIHRAFVFGHLRREQSFALAASISAAIFALQHVYLVFTIGAIPGWSSVLLALLLAFPLAFLYERGGNSLAAPAILHTSSNAPMMLFATPEVAAAVILPHMAVVLGSMYLSFGFGRWLGPRRGAAT